MKYIKLFQEKHGLKNDGIIGKKTLTKFSEVYGLTSEQTAHVIGQTCHETGKFALGRENLNYSAKSLLKTFKTRFTELQALKLERQPIKIGNHVYGNRYGNTEENDGYRYRGAGAIMLTFKDNYRKFSEYINDPEIMVNADLVESKYFFEVAIYFFKVNNLLGIANKVDEATILKISKVINGGYNGIKERIEYTNKYYDMLVVR